jgi:DNA-binding transcriptional LysR family regulator
LHPCIGESITLSDLRQVRKQVEALEHEADAAAQPVERALLIGACMSWPSNSSWPDLISSSRFTVRISVDLPSPTGRRPTDDLALLDFGVDVASAW